MISSTKMQLTCKIEKLIEGEILNGKIYAE